MTGKPAKTSHTRNPPARCTSRPNFPGGEDISMSTVREHKPEPATRARRCAGHGGSAPDILEEFSSLRRTRRLRDHRVRGWRRACQTLGLSFLEAALAPYDTLGHLGSDPVSHPGKQRMSTGLRSGRLWKNDSRKFEHTSGATRRHECRPESDDRGSGRKQHCDRALTTGDDGDARINAGERMRRLGRAQHEGIQLCGGMTKSNQSRKSSSCLGCVVRCWHPMSVGKRFPEALPDVVRPTDSVIHQFHRYDMCCSWTPPKSSSLASWSASGHRERAGIGLITFATKVRLRTP